MQRSDRFPARAAVRGPESVPEDLQLTNEASKILSAIAPPPESAAPAAGVELGLLVIA
jgi:hypothetical protein